MNTSPSSTGTTKQRISRLFTYKRPWLGKLVLFTWITFLGIIVGVPLYIYSVKVDLFGLYGGMPSIREVENPENVLTSNLISADGVVLGGYFRNNSSQITYDDLSEDLVATLLYSEDHRYYQHSGLDFVAFLRVIKGVITFNNAGGGSTITQQLAKNLYTRNPNQSLDGPIARLGGYPRRIVQKTKEWIISVDLESYFTKEEIMAMYLNTVGLFSDTYGIKVAAQTYFNKSTDSLNLIESATLVGMLQNPSRFNPVYYPDNAIRKRNEVLKKLQNFGYKIKSDNEYDSLASLPLGLDYNIQNHNEGLATYFRSVMTNYLMQWCNERNIDLWNSGIRIYTTIDSRLQQYAEEAMTEHMREYQKLFEEQLNGRNPWVDDDGKEIQGYVRSRVRRTATYRNLVEEYGRNSDSIEMVLRRKKPMRVFSWEGEIDTLLNSYDSMEYYLKFLQAGFMAMDPTTGYIKAWVGGIDHKYFQYDHVKQGTRQPGSTFKPFVYGLAMENGYSPFQPMEDVAPTFYMDNRPPYTPSNADGTLGSGEIMTLRQAMARSVNSITAQLLKQLGPENVVEFAHRMGISSKLDAVPSLSLGVSDVSLFELVGAYSTYANGGKYTLLHYPH